MRSYLQWRKLKLTQLANNIKKHLDPRKKDILSSLARRIDVYSTSCTNDRSVNERDKMLDLFNQFLKWFHIQTIFYGNNVNFNCPIQFLTWFYPETTNNVPEARSNPGLSLDLDLDWEFETDIVVVFLNVLAFRSFHSCQVTRATVVLNPLHLVLGNCSERPKTETRGVGEWEPQISFETFNYCPKITATHKMQQPWCAQAKQVAGCCLETQRDTTTKAERETELKRTGHGRTRTTQGRTRNCRWLIGISKVRQNQRTQIYWENVSRAATKKNLTATPKITRTRLRLAKWAGNN